MSLKFSKKIALAVLIGCSACSNTNAPTPESRKAPTKINSELGRIEKAIQRGNIKEACKLKVQLTKNIDITSGLSEGSLKSIKEIQVKCKTRTISIQVNND